MTDSADRITHIVGSLQHTEKAVDSARAARKKRWICFAIFLVILIIIAIIVAVEVAGKK
jgi:syntaxin 1B/2/3